MGCSLQYTADFVQHRTTRYVPSMCHCVNSILCITGMDCYNCIEEDEHPGLSADWIHAVDRVGLIHINNITFELFLSMEHDIRRCVKASHELGDIRSLLKGNERCIVLLVHIDSYTNWWWCHHHPGDGSRSLDNSAGVGGRVQDCPKENHTIVQSEL